LFEVLTGSGFILLLFVLGAIIPNDFKTALFRLGGWAYKPVNELNGHEVGPLGSGDVRPLAGAYFLTGEGFTDAGASGGLGGGESPGKSSDPAKFAGARGLRKLILHSTVSVYADSELNGNYFH
jgi:hypothetical protein